VSFDTLLTVLFVVVFIVLPLVSRVLRERNRPPASRQPPARPRAPGSTPAETAPTSGQGNGGQEGTGQEGTGGSDLPAWVVEAQRRVREARERATAQASTRPEQAGTLVSEDPFGPPVPADRQRTMVPEDPFRGRGGSRTGDRKLVPGDAFEKGLVGPGDAQRAGPGLGREGVPPVPDPGAGRETASEAERRTRTDAGEAFGMPGRQAPRPRAASEEGPRAGGAPARAQRHPWPDGARLAGVGQLRFDREAIVSGLIWHEILDEPAWKRRRGRAPSRPRSR